MPALPPYIIEPIWEQFEALLPERRTNHPLGCHRRRIPDDKVVFGKLVEVSVFGCAYWRISDESCSESTLRRRRNGWIEAGAMETLREIPLQAYGRLIGLEMADLAVDGCITKAPPCGGEEAGRSPADRGKGGVKRSTVVDARGIPLGSASPPRPIVTTRRSWRRPSAPWSRSESCRIERACIFSTAPTTRPPLAASWRLVAWSARSPRRASRPRSKPESGGWWNAPTPGTTLTRRSWRGVPRGVGAGHRFLGGLLRGSHHRQGTHPRSLEPLPLGRPTFPPTMTY